MKVLSLSGLLLIILSFSVYFDSCAQKFTTAPLRKCKAGTIIEGTSDTSSIQVTRVGYATVIISSGKDKLLIDPWFSEKPAYYHGEDSLAMTVSQLPHLSAIASTQDHYDHFDIHTLAAYPEKDVPLLVCAGSKQKKVAEEEGFTNIVELANFESIRIGGMKITSFESKSSEKPSSFDYERNYIIETNGKVLLYVGHIMQESVQRAVRARFPAIDVVLLPVNDLRIKLNLNEQKAFGPDDAAKLCEMLRPTVAIPVHYNFKGSWLTNTFLLKQKGTPEKFAQTVRERKLTTKVIITETGQNLIL